MNLGMMYRVLLVVCGVVSDIVTIEALLNLAMAWKAFFWLTIVAGIPSLRLHRLAPLDVCFVNSLPVPWERRRLACVRSGLEARAPRRLYTGAGLAK
jgi:hypothetical protein